jgi:hypothetical protein
MWHLEARAIEPYTLALLTLVLQGVDVLATSLSPSVTSCLIDDWACAAGHHGTRPLMAEMVSRHGLYSIPVEFTCQTNREAALKSGCGRLSDEFFCHVTHRGSRLRLGLFSSVKPDSRSFVMACRDVSYLHMLS